MLAGLGAALLASLLFGSVYVPIKKSPPSDGFIAQFFLCIGSLIVGILIHAMQGFPQLYPLAMLGGALWCIANAFAIKIMNKLGMALGILVWNSTSCLSGWATSRFGLFGVPVVEPASVFLNYIGVGFLILGACLYVFVKSNPMGQKGEVDIQAEKEKEAAGEEVEHHDHDLPMRQRICYVLAAVVSGVFYGSMVTPVTYIQSHSDSLFPGAPSSGLPYVLPFFMGVFLTSAVVLTVYSLLHQNVSLIDGLLTLRALSSGVIFGFGIAFFFIANELLSPTVAYPLGSMAPGLIASLWSVLYFHEITGRRNLTILCVAYCTTLFGVACVAVSKEFVW